MLFTTLIFVEWVELYTLRGERPPAIFRLGRRSCAGTCQITREDGAIIDTCMVDEFYFFEFSDLPRAPAPLCCHGL